MREAESPPPQVYGGTPVSTPTNQSVRAQALSSHPWTPDICQEKQHVPKWDINPNFVKKSVKNKNLDYLCLSFP